MKSSDFEKQIAISGKYFTYFDITELDKLGYDIASLPFSIRILVENAARKMDGKLVKEQDLDNIAGWRGKYDSPVELPYYPSRILLQDFTGVPAVVDLAAMRDAIKTVGGNPKIINPFVPVDLVIDHSVQIDYYGTSDSLEQNVKSEYRRNAERYSLLKWAQKSFSNLRVVPPGAGICHQVNLEYLGSVVNVSNGVLLPDTLIGTDSHTPMIAGAGVMAWGVGGIEAEAVMMGEPYYMSIPEVVGVELVGKADPGVVATDIVLYITEKLRAKGVVGKFVEYFGKGVDELDIPDRATISNMSPEYGATMGFFPIDEKTLDYLRLTNRKNVEIVENYTKRNAMFRAGNEKIDYSDVIRIYLSDVKPAVAGPSRPQDRIALEEIKTRFYEIVKENYEKETDLEYISRFNHEAPCVDYSDIKINHSTVHIDNEEFDIKDGSVVIAAITSCTNTSNPEVMIGAALVAKKAVEAGLRVPAYVKTSFAPGSKVVYDYLVQSGLMPYLEALGFHLAAFGCTTCIGNSGPLKKEIAQAIEQNNLNVAAVLSGNRNFEARIHQKIRSNFLMSPMLVVAFAIAGRVDIDLYHEPIGINPNGRAVFLKNILPAREEILQYKNKFLKQEYYKKRYDEIFKGDHSWNNLKISSKSILYDWDNNSTYIKKPPFFDDFTLEINAPSDIINARALLVLGDSVTTDHISPAGEIPEEYPAGRYLIEQGVAKKQFNSYGSRRGNHEVMMRGTFANVRIKNLLVEPKEGGYTVYFPENKQRYVFDAAMEYVKNNIPLIVLAGKEYGTGSSRDWAAKGTALLGVKAIIAESYERIHRSNLIGMGILPLEFTDGDSYKSIGLDGSEIFDIAGIADIAPGKRLQVTASKSDSVLKFEVIARLDTDIEVAYFKNSGILQYVLRNLTQN